MLKAKSVYYAEKGAFDVTPDILFSGPWIHLYLDPYSARVRLDDYSGTADAVMNLINKHLPAWTEKIIVKARPEHVAGFELLGLRKEAIVYRYFSGDDMYFMTSYPKVERAISANPIITPEDISAPGFNPEFIKADSVVSEALPKDAEELADLFVQVFPQYPTPVGDPAYLRDMMNSGTVYMFMKSGNKIVSAASAETDLKYRNAELTDCATLPEARGRGNMVQILAALISHLENHGIRSIYTIARAESVSMNRIFSGLGFRFTGCLVNNVRIFTGIEDMLVWTKP